MRSPIMELIERHDEYRSNALNLLPSENFLSDEVRRALASDLAGRYSLKIGGYVHGAWVDNAYGGTRYAEEIMDLTERMAEEIFRAKYAEVRALSGHISAEIMLLSTTKKGEIFMAISAENGGYDGYMPGYLPDMFSLHMEEIPFDESEGNIDYGALERKVRETEPKLIVLGASYFPFPYDLRRIREFYDGYLGYDASHVLGLIATGAFQLDIHEYVDIMVGSTHKSLYGPQGGLVLVYNEELIERVRLNTTWRTLDNPHLNRIAALGQALFEIKHDMSYGKKVVESAKSLAKALDNNGIPVRFAPRYTESHQILLDTEGIEREWHLTPSDFSKTLERNRIITDSVGRLGVTEVVHRGMGKEDMGKIAVLIRRALEGEDVSDEVGEVVSALREP